MTQSENTLFHEISKYTNMSLDTMEEEDAIFYKERFGIEYLNATSNQAICFNNWVKHPIVILQAFDLAIKKFQSQSKSIPTSTSDASFAGLIEQIIVYAIAITGKNQSKNIKGKVLSQVKPSLVKNTTDTYNYAKSIIEAYEEIGLDRTKVIIKIPVTYESMQAVKLLAKENISCLGTVVHTLEQAVISAEAGCAAISPYVDSFDVNLDPASYSKTDLSKDYGYLETVKIHKYYKAYGIPTVICIAAMIGLNTMIYMSGIDEMTIPLVDIHKCLAVPPPKDVEFPALKTTYSVEEAGPKLTFINDKDKYYQSLNETGVARINDAVEFFNGMHEKSALLIKNTLVEFGKVKA